MKVLLIWPDEDDLEVLRPLYLKQTHLAHLLRTFLNMKRTA